MSRASSSVRSLQMGVGAAIACQKQNLDAKAESQRQFPHFSSYCSVQFPNQPQRVDVEFAPRVSQHPGSGLSSGISSDRRGASLYPALH